MPEPAELSYAQCRELIGSGVLGRVAFADDHGIAVLPVNYSVVNESIIFRTSAYSTLARVPIHETKTAAVSFQVDQVDYDTKTGWSVLARGATEVIDDDDELAHIKRTWDPEPWASGPRPIYIRLRFKELSGRRLTAH